MMLSNKLLALSSDPNTDIETIQSAISSLTVTEGDSIANFDDVVMQTFADLDSEKMKPIST